jgi:hypothetical protein
MSQWQVILQFAENWELINKKQKLARCSARLCSILWRSWIYILMGIGFAHFCYMEYNGIITHSWLFFYGKRFKGWNKDVQNTWLTSAFCLWVPNFPQIVFYFDLVFSCYVPFIPPWLWFCALVTSNQEFTFALIEIEMQCHYLCRNDK